MSVNSEASEDRQRTKFCVLPIAERLLSWKPSLFLLACKLQQRTVARRSDFSGMAKVIYISFITRCSVGADTLTMS
jgi:hypothetical protein